MKKLLIIICACFMYVGLQAKVWQVNNNAGSTVTILLQTAIDNANSGDTLYIAGSPNVYDATNSVILNKKLTLIGPGYFLGENNQTQSSIQTAKIWQLEIGQGADNSVIMGLDFITNSTGYAGLFFSTDTRTSSGTIPSNNVTIRRNAFKYVEISLASGTIVEQNYFSHSGGNNIWLRRTSSNTIIQNNIFISSSSYATIFGESGYSLTNTVIKNNSLSNGLYRLNGIEIDNNIFFSGALNECTNNVLKNNVWVSNQVVAIPANSPGNNYESYNNKFSVTAGDLFVKATPTVDNEFKLKAASPAAGAAIDGIDAGAFGGLNAYKLSGLPPIPSIYEVTTTGVGTKENGLKVVIKAKSNN